MRHTKTLYAAVPTPRQPDGALDRQALNQLLTMQCAQPIDGIVVNGATGEYPNQSLEQAMELFRVCGEMLAGRIPFACGIGTGTTCGAVSLGRTAAAAGAFAVLLPTPSFFPYAQDDVLAFCTAVEAGLSIPIILYNLPQFTTGFEILAVRALAVRSGIIGIKDSSGLLDICRSLSGNGNRFQRLVGNDMVIVQALDEGICDGVISGVAGVLPELISFLVRRHTPEHSARYRRANRLLEELLEKLSAFPTPWAIKWIAESRGFGAASFLQPLSEQRRHEAKRFQEWFAAWWDGVARFLESA